MAPISFTSFLTSALTFALTPVPSPKGEGARWMSQWDAITNDGRQMNPTPAFKVKRETRNDKRIYYCPALFYSCSPPKNRSWALDHGNRAVHRLPFAFFCGTFFGDSKKVPSATRPGSKAPHYVRKITRFRSLKGAYFSKRKKNGMLSAYNRRPADFDRTTVIGPLTNH